ncbi:hypothetical protein LIER_12991 [Lithospermum erythrorhizon]|uniref:GAG-pre-integrase domain-containing protein n=1 Tax=Lithospermum erythrorhizon TaxID=34254 RepID=A0AAV3PZ09_LITER
MDEEEWKELDMQVLGMIRPCFSRNVVANVAKETTTKGLMKVLSNLYEKPSANNKLDGDGYRTTFGDSNWKVAPRAMIVALDQKMGTLYLTGDSQKMIAVVEGSEKTGLWHNRLGHISEKGMKLLVSNNLIPKLKSVDHHICESCVLGNQKKISFIKTGVKHKSDRLELVHTNVWGPVPVGSVGGSLYYVTFIDDATRKVWVYFMKHKSEVNGVFKNWKAMIENETGLKKTILETPQKNGVAERMNRMLNERARSMRLHTSDVLG